MDTYTLKFAKEYTEPHKPSASQRIAPKNTSPNMTNYLPPARPEFGATRPDPSTLH